MLAEEWLPKKHDVGGWFCSAKLDGQRAFWDGSISRGLKASDVPYMNTTKDGRYVTPPICTGLISRYGKCIQAPDWFLDQLPIGVNLDVELWAGNGTFQQLRSTVSKLEPDEAAWKSVTAMVIDAPDWHALLMDGEIKNANWKKLVVRDTIMPWVISRCAGQKPFGGYGKPGEAYQRLDELWESSGSPAAWRPMDQFQLPRHPDDAREEVERRLNEVTAKGGEGLILRDSAKSWLPMRVQWLLKAKKLSDAEGTVTGFTWGRRTDKGSRLLGKMGALVLRLDNGKRLELSGFSDEERQVHRVDGAGFEECSIDNGIGERVTVPAESVAQEGKDATGAWEPVQFPRGTRCTFTYRELSDDGIPKEARFMRKRGNE